MKKSDRLNSLLFLSLWCLLSGAAGFVYSVTTGDTFFVSAGESDGPVSEGGTPASGTLTGSRDVPARSVHLELNRVEGSVGYDVEIKAYDQKWAKPYSFHITDEHLRVRLTPGHYKVHTRSYTADGRTGRWGKYFPFWIQFRAPDVAFPPPNARIKPMGDKMEKITFEWKPVPSAKGYIFKLKDKDGKIIKHTTTVDTWYVTEVEINSKYSWQIVPIVDKHLESPDQVYTFNDFTVLPPGEGMRSMKFSVDGNPKAVKYQFEFVRINDSNEPSPPSMFDAREPDFKVRLRPGRYEVRVRSIDKDSAVSDWSSPQKFFIDFFPPVVIGPAANEIVEADDDDAADVKLKWEPVPDVHHYKVYVFDKDGQMVVQMPVDTNSATVKLRHNRQYSWKVVAYSAEEPDRRPASVDDKDINTFILEKYERVDLNVAEESSAWYGWLRTVSSQVDFVGQNYDNNTLITQNVLANSAELAAGVWIRKTNWGFLASGAISGYRTDTQTFTFGNGGFNVGYRHIYNANTRLRVWAGYYYRELPELLANPYDTSYRIVKLRDSGPQIQGSVHHAINDKWGWHGYGTFYYGLQNQGTPTGLPAVPQLSYTLGIAATYKFSNYYTGMIGYAYRREHAQYNSTDRSGNPNDVDFTGHYLNFILEFGLSKPHPLRAEND